MTYNVLSGTLNLAQSVSRGFLSLEESRDICFYPSGAAIVGVQGVRHGHPENSGWRSPTPSQFCI